MEHLSCMSPAMAVGALSPFQPFQVPGVCGLRVSLSIANEVLCCSMALVCQIRRLFSRRQAVTSRQKRANRRAANKKLVFAFLNAHFTCVEAPRARPWKELYDVLGVVASK